MTKYNYIFKRTCYLSRWRETILPLVHWNKPMTLHSLCAKIFETVIMKNYQYKSNFILDGDYMNNYVKDALITLKLSCNDIEVNQWVSRIREHFNSGKNISNYPNGSSVLEKYLLFKGDGLDWEDSFQYAKYLLDNNELNRIKGFYFDYIIFVDDEKLNVKDNKNALDFICSLKSWNAKHTKKNIYSFNADVIKKVEIFNDEEEEFIETFIEKRSYDEFDDFDVEYIEELKRYDDED